MALTLIDPRNSPNPLKFNHFIGENYEIAVNQSMKGLLDSESRDFSAFSSTFYELVQARANPPLETIWVYSASKFSPKDEPLDRVSAIKGLFQLICGCSASCSSSKSIVLLAPVIYEVYRVIVDLKAKDLGSKKEKKVMREIKSLVNAILGHISVCCSANDDGDVLGSDSDALIRPLGDLIRVWIGEALEEKEGFKLFFPLLDDGIFERLSVEGSVVSELAGAVMAETFLLRLCLDFRSDEVSKNKLQKELTIWAVGSITGFRHFYFFDTLVRMLLEHTLPVTSILNSEDEVSLRNILYDAVILVEYSFLNPDKVIHLPPKRIKSLAIARVVVTNEAIELFRGKGDQTKAISYITVFSGSQLPSQLIKLVTNEIGMHKKAGQPKGLSPKALLKWLLDLEHLGFILLDDGITKCRSRLALDMLEAEHEQLANNTEGTKSKADVLFFIDNKGEGKGEDRNEDDEKTRQSMSAAFVAAAHMMTTTEENGGERKRKKGRSVEKKRHIKFLKYNLYTNSGSLGEKSTFLINDGSSSESEVENPISDEDIKEKEKRI